MTMIRIFSILLCGISFQVCAKKFQAQAFTVRSKLPITLWADYIILQRISKKALQYTNEFRAQHHGLPQLQWSEELAYCALVHAYNMAIGQANFSHDGFETRIGNLREQVWSYGENLYMGNYSGDQSRIAVDGWINSPGHCKNLLGDWTHCGIAACKNDLGFWYFTQIFAKV